MDSRFAPAPGGRHGLRLGRRGAGARGARGHEDGAPDRRPRAGHGGGGERDSGPPGRGRVRAGRDRGADLIPSPGSPEPKCGVLPLEGFR
ncbi:hypothetical protein OIE13_08055 [Streptosporangium sp. NBC_01810]|nr:hypothetical protein OIE13_08055 [Streptosporangium sp. NBC_01810]